MSDEALLSSFTILAALLQGDRHLDECTHLWEEAFAEGSRHLAELLGYGT